MQKPLSRDNGWQIWHRNMKLMSLSLLNILQNCILFQGHLGQRSRSKSHNIQKSAYFPFTTFHLYFMVPLKSYACIARIRTKTGPRMRKQKSHIRTKSLQCAQKLVHEHSKSCMRGNCLSSVYHISLILNWFSQVLHVHSQNKDQNGTAHAQTKIAHAHK